MHDGELREPAHRMRAIRQLQQRNEVCDARGGMPSFTSSAVTAVHGS